MRLCERQDLLGTATLYAQIRNGKSQQDKESEVTQHLALCLDGKVDGLGPSFDDIESWKASGERGISRT